MDFKKWLTEDGDLNGSAATGNDDPDMNGLLRQSYLKNKSKKKTKADKLDKLFGMTESKDLKSGASIFFTDGKSVLILKRSDASSNPRTWSLPGGHAHHGESPIQTAKREAEEECGHSTGRQFGVLKEPNWKTYFFKVNSKFMCKLNDEHTEWEWVKFENLSKKNLHPCFRRNMERYFEIMASF